MDERGLNEIESNFANPIHDEMSRGLSLEALNIDGRAPLNELSQELSKKIQNSIIDMEGIKKTAQGEGNKHRQDEANKYYTKVTEEYQRRYENDFKPILDDYNDDDHEGENRKYFVDKTYTKIENGQEVEYTKPAEYYYDKAVCTWEKDKEIIYAVPDTAENDNNKGKHNGYIKKINDSAKNLNEFYDTYVAPAIKLKNECDQLEPYGNQEGATMRRSDYSNGSTRDIYTKSDGSTVTIDRDADGNKTFQRSEDKNGNVTETIFYDEDGNIKERYEFRIEKESEGVYKSTPTHYVQDENDKTKLNEDTKYSEKHGPTYSWKDQNGIMHIGAPDTTASTPTATPATIAATIGTEVLETASTGPSYNYDEFTTSVNNKEDIELPPGYVLKYDGDYFTEDNHYLQSTEDKPLKLVYSETLNKYIAYEKVDGEYKLTEEWIALDPERMIGGNNNGHITTGNDTTLFYDKNNDGIPDVTSPASKEENNQSSGMEESGGE